MFYWIKTHWIVKKIWSNFTWDIPNSSNKVFLTFDDGPTPEITHWVLTELQKHKAKATFFCIGDNVRKNPEIFENIINHGHKIGNHTFNHLNGWKTATKNYIKNTQKCFVNNHENRQLFRPPYGKIKMSQAKILQKMGYKIIMWDVLSADFDSNVSQVKCLENVLSNITSGSIVVFHDSQKAFKNLEYVLPRTLEFIAKKGFVCDVIDVTLLK